MKLIKFKRYTDRGAGSYPEYPDKYVYLNPESVATMEAMHASNGVLYTHIINNHGYQYALSDSPDIVYAKLNGLEPSETPAD